MAGLSQFPPAMPRPNAPVSLAELGAAGVRLRPYEAVTIVRELALQVVRGQIAGVPSAHVVRLSGSGYVSIEGPVAAGGRPVVRAAQLLESLLPAATAEAGSDFRIPGALKLVMARALGTLDLPPFGSLEAFVEALDRFAATDPQAAIATLAVSCIEAASVRLPDAPAAAAVPVVAAQVQPFVGARANEPRIQAAREPLTISDIRRARRATGVPLSKVASRSRIPVGLLRQLEWGYFFNWPKGRYGRSQLVRYARAAGLDEELVVATVTPLLDHAEPLPALVPQVAAEPAALAPRPSSDLELTAARESEALPVLFAATPAPARRGRRTGLIGLAAAAALAVVVAPMWWNYPDRPAAPAAQVAREESAPAAAPVPPVANVPPAISTQGASSASAEAVREPAAPASTTGSAGAARNQLDGHADGAAPPASDAEYLLAADRSPLAPSFASPGTAMFYPAEDGAAARGETEGDGSVLRITRIVDDAAKNFHVRPSPDGSRIAFDSNRDGVRGVYVADEDGQNVRRVSGDGFAAMPSWSPDGQTLAFVRAERAAPQVWNLWTMELESGRMRQVTNLQDGQPWGASWFPDGRRIAYGSGGRLVIRDLESGSERVFATPVKGRAVRTPTVSPDGRRVVFQVERDGAWLLELPRGAVRRVLEDPTTEEFTWAPDGHRLAYYSRRTGTWGVWVMASR